MSILNHSPTIVRDGLVLCLDAGAVRSYPGAGPQLVVNGDFASDITTGWQPQDGLSTRAWHDTGGDGGRLKLIDPNDGENARLYSSAAITTVIGQKYRFSVTVSGTSTNHFVHCGTSLGGVGNPVTNFTLGGGDGTYVHDFVATATTFYIHLGATGGSTQYFDQVSLVAIASNLSLPGDSGYSSGVSYGVPGANQWSDLSGNNNNGALNNMQYDLDAESGAGGTRSFDFDGSSDYISFSAKDYGISATWTVAWWMKMDSSGLQCFFSMKESGSNNKIEFITNSGIREIFGNLRDHDGTVIQVDTDNTVWNTGEWTHVAITNNGGTATSSAISFYINGEAKSNNVVNGATITPMEAGSRTLNIGKEESGSRYVDGKMAIVHMYSRALTASEIQQNYRTHKGRFGL